jgi:hypothetical protein
MLQSGGIKMTSVKSLIASDLINVRARKKLCRRVDHAALRRTYNFLRIVAANGALGNVNWGHLAKGPDSADRACN